MQANRSRDTSTECAVRRIAHSRGMRYRVNSRPESRIRRTADMEFFGAQGRVHRRVLLAWLRDPLQDAQVQR